MPGDEKNTLHDNAIGWLILFVLLLCVCWLIWYYQEYQIKNLYRWIRWSEMWAVSLVVDDDYSVAVGPDVYDYQQLVDYVPKIQNYQLNGEVIRAISMLAMVPLRMIFIVILVLMGFWALLFGPGTQFRRKMNIDGLITVQSKVFPAIAPFIKFNPSNQPPRPPGAPVPAELPLFAEALAPEEWIAYNEIPVPDGQIDENAAYLAFARQLGPRWQGALKMTPYKQVLLAAFCLKSVRKRKETDELLGRLANCWSHEQGLQLRKDSSLLKDAQKILRDKGISAKTLGKCNRHAFETTVLLSALATAREEGGVLAPAQFVWLRGHDRALWYPLNNLGRQSYHIEALGAMAHYKAERMTQRPIPKPKVQDAVKTIVEYTRSRRARPIPQLDYSKSKKRGIKKPKQPKRK